MSDALTHPDCVVTSGKNTAPCAAGFCLSALETAYYNNVPEPQNPAQRVVFGTSGHRGKARTGSFNEAHIVAITQAVCDFRVANNITGPLFMGRDTHALSPLAYATALEVLVANNVFTVLQHNDAPLPTPVISHAILRYNAHHEKKGDGIVITPSHNPPEDGGFKYNEPHGGPASTQTTRWIETRANEYLQNNNRGVRRGAVAHAKTSDCVSCQDLVAPYVQELACVVDMQSIAHSGLRLGADPLGGAAISIWQTVADVHGLNLSVVNPVLDPSFSFMPPDHDGIIRMDCSSPYAMAHLVGKAAKYDLSFATDTDADRHGIVAGQALMNANNYLTVAIWHLLQHRPQWAEKIGVGKTAVTTALIDRICQQFERPVYETPAGFKWFVPGLVSGQLAFGGEESAGASFLRFNGTPWSTDKDGIIMCLLAAEIMAKNGKNPAALYQDITANFGQAYFARQDAPASAAQRKALLSATPKQVTHTQLAGCAVTGVYTTALGNGEKIGGIKVVANEAWFAVRPSGTEDLYKIYAESFISRQHLAAVQAQAIAVTQQLFENTHE